MLVLKIFFKKYIIGEIDKRTTRGWTWATGLGRRRTWVSSFEQGWLLEISIGISLEFINSRAKTLPRFVSLNGFVSLLLTQMRGRGFGLESDLVRFSSVIVLLARDFGRKIYSRDLFLTRRACYVASKVIPFRGKSRR